MGTPSRANQRRVLSGRPPTLVLPHGNQRPRGRLIDFKELDDPCDMVVELRYDGQCWTCGAVAADSERPLSGVLVTKSVREAIFWREALARKGAVFIGTRNSDVAFLNALRAVLGKRPLHSTDGSGRQAVPA